MHALVLDYLEELEGREVGQHAFLRREHGRRQTEEAGASPALQEVVPYLLDALEHGREEAGPVPQKEARQVHLKILLHVEARLHLHVHAN